jgi:putative addiction module killer protein
VPTVHEYQTDDGRSPFGEWFWRLDARAAAKITRVIGKLGSGLRPDVQPVGQGVFEARIHFGPGYRVYFGLDGNAVVILLGGGDKRSQADDISHARARWADYRARKQKDSQYGAYP